MGSEIWTHVHGTTGGDWEFESVAGGLRWRRGFARMGGGVWAETRRGRRGSAGVPGQPAGVVDGAAGVTLWVW